MYFNQIETLPREKLRALQNTQLARMTQLRE